MTETTRMGDTGTTGVAPSGTVHDMTPNWTPGIHRPTSRASDITTAALTFIAAMLATAVAAVGMWRFFGDVLHLTNPYLRGGLFAFLEIALFVEAIRARRNLLEDLAALRAEGEDSRRASTGVDGKAVWAIAALSGVFSALDGRSTGEQIFRLVAPLVAAWLWERGLAVHRRRARGVRLFRGVEWGGAVDRVLIRLRLLRVAERSATQVERARRIARLAALRHRVEELRNSRAFGWRIGRATRRFKKALAKANEEFGFAEDEALRAALQLNLAVLYRSVEGTGPAAVARLLPWGETPPDLPVAPATADSVAPVTPAAVAPATGGATRSRNAPSRTRRRGGHQAATKQRVAPVTHTAVAAATDRSDDALAGLIAPLVAGATEAPSQRALQKVIKDATGASVNANRLGVLVDLARNAHRNETPAEKVNGNVPAGVTS